MRLTNEQVGVISRAHFSLKAANRYITIETIDDAETPIELIEDDVSYAVKQLEKVFPWLDFDRVACREDEDE